MTRSSDRKATQCHVLDFFYDNDDGCAVTVILNGIRFHVIADIERLKGQSKAENAIEKQYRNLISCVQDDVEDEKSSGICTEKSQLDTTGTHGAGDESPDSGVDTGSGYSMEEKTNDGDSAVDIDEDTEVKEVGLLDGGVVLGQQSASESEIAIQNWMLSPFGEIFKDLAPPSKTPRNLTLEDWYHGPAFFYTLDIKEGRLYPTQEEMSEELEKRMTDLVPRMRLPKYIQDLDIPLVQAKDVVVLEEGAAPEPYHPTRVEVNNKKCFLKMVDMLQHQPTKREIKTLKMIEKKGLHKEFRVPQVLGLVYERSKSEIMGFLQTDIKEPTPLTKMLDSDVIEDSRQKWADETQRIVSLLHNNDIIWGDAKADNFVVDKHSNLWIIDFGGSYTEGWIDPDLAETEDGDRMGTEKIVKALQDPESNTFDPEDGSVTNQVEDSPPSSKKRPRNDEDDEVQDTSSKRRR